MLLKQASMNKAQKKHGHMDGSIVSITFMSYFANASSVQKLQWFVYRDPYNHLKEYPDIVCSDNNQSIHSVKKRKRNHTPKTQPSITLPETNSSPLKIGRAPKGK